MPNETSSSQPQTTRGPSSPPTRWRARAANHFGIESPAEFIGATILLAALIAFRLVNIVTWKFDTDESQHAHVIWGWARGFVAYRDLCDNHMPLFHLVFAPIYNFLGDGPHVLIWLRLILFPAYLLSAWATYRIGESLYSRRVGLWSAIIVGFYPGYYFLSGEFRTDNLWAALWLLCVLTLVAQRLTLARAIAAGLLMGVCFGISMKTTLLFLSVIVAGGVSLLLFRKEFHTSSRDAARCFFAFVFCALVLPLMIMLSFALAGVWPQFRYWVFENNILPGLMNHPAWWRFLFPTLFPLAVIVTWRHQRRLSDRATALRRTFVLSLCAFYILALWSYWNLVTRQDYLPFHPLAFIFYTAAILRVSDRAVVATSWSSSSLRRCPLPIIVAGSEFLVAFVARPVWLNPGKAETDLLRATYGLTNPGDFVLDLKGETIFRQRAFAPIWEPLVMERIRRRLIVDDAAERAAAVRACVATKHKDMSAAATRFIDDNYLPIGSGLYVAGHFLQPAADDGQTFRFDVAIPASYVIASAAGAANGDLDGQPYDGARFLTPGRHTFVNRAPVQLPLAFYWSQAADRHFTPFQ
ncbi:MAG: glycosyltransferase family 39 protein [Verrucomicrobiota bacterium]|nr:glycosyltransferase family 39 protein [Verrucomicrobiota bacterium]